MGRPLANKALAEFVTRFLDDPELVGVRRS